MDLDACQPCVRPREVEELEDAERAPLDCWDRLEGARPVVVGDQQLARPELAFEGSADQVERAALGRDDRVVPEPAERGSLCILEFFYLARPDTRLSGVEIHGARVRMGEQLAAEAPVDADLVLPIPDSGTPAAIGFARATGIPFSEGLIKNRYVGRTFIQPEQGMREQGIRMKFNPLDEVAGKRLVVVDDSIVRGSTTRQIVQMLFDAGSAEVHVRISSPPIVGQCFYGIDLASRGELIAADHTVEEVREAIGATSLAYISLEGLQAATRRPADALCRACLTGDYPTRLPTDGGKLRFEAAGV